MSLSCFFGGGGMNATRHKGQFIGRKTRPQRQREDSEFAIQKTFAAWCKMCLPDDVLSFAVTNENGGSAGYGAKLKAQGRRAGVADYAIVYQGKYHAIEFKAKSGSQRDTQRDFEHACHRAGSPYAIARSSEQAIALLNKWGIPHNDKRNKP